MNMVFKKNETYSVYFGGVPIYQKRRKGYRVKEYFLGIRFSNRYHEDERVIDVINNFYISIKKQLDTVDNNMQEVCNLIVQTKEDINKINVQLSKESEQNSQISIKTIAVDSNMREVHELVKQTKEDINKVSTQFDKENAQISKIDEKITAINKKIIYNIDRTRTCTDKPFALKGTLELCAIVADFYENYTNILPEKFKALTKGLDENSYQIVAKILKRLAKAKSCPDGQYIDILTCTEKRVIRYLQEQFYDKIIKLADDYFIYKNYILPMPILEAGVFFYNANLDYIKNIDTLRNKDIIDAGAFIGDSALLFSPLTDKKVYSFEPSEKNIAYLNRTITLNNLKNVVAIPSALGDKENTAELVYSFQGSSLGNNFNPHLAKSTQFETVNVITLDSYVEKHDLRVGLIKTDVEGFEQPLLRGAIKTIQSQKPILMISIYHNLSDFFDIKPMIESWGLGYSFKIVKPEEGSAMLETMLIAEVV